MGDGRAGDGVVGEMVTFAAHYIISDWRQRERGVYVCVWRTVLHVHTTRTPGGGAPRNQSIQQRHHQPHVYAFYAREILFYLYFADAVLSLAACASQLARTLQIEIEGVFAQNAFLCDDLLLGLSRSSSEINAQALHLISTKSMYIEF